jgi:cytochrome subunit of sulfide dehydrogenase
MSVVTRLALALALAGSTSPVLAQAPAPAADPNLARNLAATCANCHGTNGKSVGGMVALAGLPKESIVRTMTEFKEGKRPATIMHQLAKGYTDEQIVLIAEYLSKQSTK